MNRNERALLRSALAEAMTSYHQTPSPERESFVLGIRFCAAILGMPEASSTFDWSAQRPTREARRRQILDRVRNPRAHR